MRRALAVALAASLGLALPVSAQDIRFQPKMSSTTVKAGTGTGSLTLGGVLCKGAPVQATTTTSEEVLATCTIPANSLMAAGASVRVHFIAHTAANANNKTMYVRIGGIAGTIVYQSAAVALNNQNIYSLLIEANYKSATKATVIGGAQYLADGATGAATSYSLYANRDASITWTNANDLVITALTPTATGDLTLDSYTVEVVQ